MSVSSAEGGAPPRASLTDVLIIVAPAILLVLLAANFARHQTIWVDETTQLSGLTLGYGEVVGWLQGVEADRFGVPADRMPPLSYWLGKAWAGLFGLNVPAMRWFGITCVAIATILIAATGRRIAGRPGALIAGLMMALSPNVISMAPEIRAYPLFILQSAATFFCLVEAISRPPEKSLRWTWGMGALAASACYTHFFGVLLTISVWSARLLAGYLRKEPLLKLLAPAATTFVLMLGVAPFVIFSVALSKGAGPGPTAQTGGDAVRFLYRLIGHPAISLNTLAAALLAAAFGTLLVFLIAKWRRWEASAAVVLGSLVCGIAMTVCGGIVAKGFNPFQPSYSTWMLPAIALLPAAALGLGKLSRFAQVLRYAAIAGVLLAESYGAVSLVRYADYFSHGPHRELAELVRKYGSENIAVAHTGQWGLAYFPLWYEFGAAVPQFVVVTGDNSSVSLATPASDPEKSPKFAPDTVAQRYLLLVDTRPFSARELRDVIRDPKSAPFSAGGPSDFLAANGWRQVESRDAVAFFGARATVFERSSATQEVGLSNGP